MQMIQGTMRFKNFEYVVLNLFRYNIFHVRTDKCCLFCECRAGDVEFS